MQLAPEQPSRKTTSKRKRKSLKRDGQQESPVKARKPIDKLIEDELNISDFATPHELNEEEKKNLYKKYNIEMEDGPKGVNEKKLQTEKRKY